MFRILNHILVVILLTLISQVGGVVWILNFGYHRLRTNKKSRFYRISTFLILYLLFTFFLIPACAKMNGRTALPLDRSGNLIPHNLITPLLNRHYVKPRLKSDLLDIAKQVHSSNKNLKVSYLDANFPFIDGFPLLPHLSHKDGRKVDLSFYYLQDGKEGNLKPANSGYGKYVKPKINEWNQSDHCKTKGHWQYDFTKYLSLGGEDYLEFDQKNTKRLINLIVDKHSTQKLFIEPHLVKRMNLNNNKIRFHGCQAVRHDDHIHYQIK